MLQELEHLSNAFDKISQEDASNLITHVNTRLRSVLNADIIDVLFKEEAKAGGIILRPLSSVVNPGGRDEAAPWPIETTSFGLWPRVFFENRTFWLEHVKHSRTSEKGIRNALSPDESQSETVDQQDVNEIFPNTDSILCMPLSIEHSPVGLFCIELPESGIINNKTYLFLKRLASCYALLVWQVKASRHTKTRTARAIEHLKASVTEARIRELTSHSGKGIFLRPFGDHFNLVDAVLCEAFASNNIELRHFVASPGAGVMEELKTELKLSPFGVADISGLNPNVLIEYGMMKVLGKDLMLLRDNQDNTELPFDINADQVDSYEIRGEKVHIIDPGSGNLMQLEQRVATFVRDLKNKGVLV